MLILSIPKPCHESWLDMTPSESGAYCKHCTKNVVDFSAMPDKRIIQHFREATQPVCGRFRNDQLTRPLIEIAPSIFAMNIPFWKKFLAALFIFFPSLITGCSGYSKQDYTKAELPVMNQTEISGKMTRYNSESGNSLITDHEIINTAPINPDGLQFVTLGFTVSSEFPDQLPYCEPVLPDFRQKQK